MTEATMRKYLVDVMKPLDAKPIENHMRAGTPDMNYIGGWIECKHMDRWPKGCDVNPVKLGHPLLKEQGLWLFRRCRHGGTAWVCLQVGREWLFFDGLDVKDYLGHVTRPELIRRSVLYFPNGLKPVELLEWLKTNSKG